MDCLITFWLKQLRSVRACYGRGSSAARAVARRSPLAPESTHHVHFNQRDLNFAYGYAGNRSRTTKYRWYTFLPKSLFVQYWRAAYWYFTAMAALSLTPFSPYTSVSVILPLAFVLVLGMGRELWEDWRRAKGDAQVNSRPVWVLAAYGEMVKMVWKDIQVGDIVRVEDRDYFPADLLLLSSSNPQGSCYVETKNLDGETNLKVRQALDCTLDLRDTPRLQLFSAHLKCDAPNASLYTFSGLLQLPSGESFSVAPQQILLRDSTLQNTGHVYGMVIYSGHDTKVMQNATPPPSKRSRIDRTLDKIIWAMFLVLFLLSLATGLVFGIITHNYGRNMYYLQPGVSDPFSNPSTAAVAGMVSFVTSLVLYGYLVPIALYVTLEIVRVIQSIFIMKDIHMLDEETGNLARVKSSGLNEELGQVDTILSDKTGTLTRNQMDFFRCSIAGVSYGRGSTEVETAARRLGLHVAGNRLDPQSVAMLPESTSIVKGFNFHDSRLVRGNWVKEEHAQVIQLFFQALALCHTAIPEENGEEDLESIQYRAESPDEAALVVAAKQFGFCFYKKTSTTLHVKEVVGPAKEGEMRVYELLNVLEFSSARKRMSIIVRFPDGRLILLCKGADSVLLERVSPTRKGWVDETMDHLRQFAELGLRTLVVAFREIAEEEYQLWNARHIAATNVMGKDRESGIEDVEDEIERSLIVIGGTGVEDKLQVGVPETIEKLAGAGIKIWVLTGDKVETAINIGYGCSLLRKGMEKIIVSLDSAESRAIDGRIEQQGLSRAEATQLLKEIVDRQLRQGQEAVERRENGCTGERGKYRKDGSFSLNSRSGHLSEQENGLELGVMGLNQHTNFRKHDYALVIDGQSLAFVLADESLQDIFLEVCLRCASVLCCRVSPRQKAQVTKLVRKGLGQNRLCLAIGDGANDVGMIQAANVGVGIAGVEGAQAAMAADYAIGQFRFLQRLLLIHGHWCYRRVSLVILYFFYKVSIMGWIALYSNFLNFMSGEPLYNSWYASLYNTAFTVLPIGVVGVMDQDLSAQQLLRHPQIYRTGQRKAYFNSRLVLLYVANSVWASLVIFFFPVALIWGRPFRAGGQVADLQDFGAMMFTGVVLVANLQLAVSLHYWTWIHHVALWGSVALWFIFLLDFGALQPLLSTVVYHELVEVLAPAASYWLLQFMVLLAALWPNLALRGLISLRFPSDVQLVREAALSVAGKRPFSFA